MSLPLPLALAALTVAVALVRLSVGCFSAVKLAVANLAAIVTLSVNNDTIVFASFFITVYTLAALAVTFATTKNI